MSNISVGQLIMDAQRMAGLVKDLDTLGSTLLVDAEDTNRMMENLRHFQDDIDSLNRICSSKSNVDMVNRIQQQNANSSEILKENRELKVCMEDYERTMEVIMQKYREHTSNKVLESKLNFKELYNEKLWMIIREQREKINEMAAVMQRAASLDEEQFVKEMETMARLRMENKSLREMLQISKQFGSDGRQIRFNDHLFMEKAVQTEADEFADDELSLSGTSIENANNTSAIYISISNYTAITDNASVEHVINNELAEMSMPSSNTDSGMDTDDIEDKPNEIVKPSQIVVAGKNSPTALPTIMNTVVEEINTAAVSAANSTT